VNIANLSLQLLTFNSSSGPYLEEIISAMGRPLRKVKITVSSELPHLRNIFLKKQASEPKKTWETFLRSHGVVLDFKRYIIVARNRVKSFMHKKISSILDSYTRKTSLTVLIEECPDKHKSKGKNKKSKKQPGSKNRIKEPIEFPMPRLTPVKNLPPSPLPTVAKFSGAKSSTIHEMSIGAGFISFDSSANNADLDDDVLSQLSQDEDVVMDRKTSLLKDEMKMAVERIPNSHILRMQEEVRGLRNSGGGRDYKWSHYCPLTAAWIFSVFKV